LFSSHQKSLLLREKTTRLHPANALCTKDIEAK
jgi:hypothetical protein